jgi:DNA-binding transcriptional MerR regulator
MRIGDVSRRTGVSAATLRVWERRYGVLAPPRTKGGHRQYGPDDVARVQALLRRMDAGQSVSAAARELTHGSAAPDVGAMAEDLWCAIDSFDEVALRTRLTTAVDTLGVAGAIDQLLAPALRRLGDEWRLSARNIGREHFASTVIRSALLQFLPRDGGGRPVCLGFCPEGEQHDLGLVMGALALAEAGWRSIVLGARTPLASVEALTDELRPDLVLVAAQLRTPALRLLERWTRPLGSAVVLGGAGFRAGDVEAKGRRTRYAASFGCLTHEVAALLAPG